MSCKIDAPDLEKIWSKLPDNMPRHGWRIVRRQNFESFILPNGKHDITKGRLCHMCGIRTRFIFWIGHYDWPVDIAVGETCASYAGCIDTEDLKRKWKDSYEMYQTKGIEAIRTLEEIALIAAQILERLMKLEREAEEAKILQQENRARELSRRVERTKHLQTLIDSIREIYFNQQAFRHNLMQIIDDLEASWMDGSAWQHTMSGVSVKCKVRTLYFPADVTLFYREGLWNYVLNMPLGKTPLYGKKYSTAMEARDASYDRLRSSFVSLWNTRDHELMLNCANYIVDNGTTTEERMYMIGWLYNTGVDL